MKKNRLFSFLLLISLSVSALSGCKNNCSHQYSVVKTVEATCTEDGYKKYKCSECRDKYEEVIPAKGHKPGEAPTLDSSQLCTVCETVLASSVDYMPYRGNDLAINKYYGYDSSYITTQIDTQNLDR